MEKIRRIGCFFFAYFLFIDFLHFHNNSHVCDMEKIRRIACFCILPAWRFLHFQKNSHVCDLEKICIGMLYIRDNPLDSELHDCLWNIYSYDYFMKLI